MKLILLLVMVVLLGACAPGAYTFTFYAPQRSAGVWVREVPREVIVEVPVLVEVPAPPVEFPPYQPPVLPPVEPPVTLPVLPVEPPIPAPWWPPAEPPAEPPADECSVQPMPPKSKWLEKIKCAGSPARLVPRP